jgi:hypothetical protein
MYFGGIPDETAILDRPGIKTPIKLSHFPGLYLFVRNLGQLVTIDFVGCIKSISINGNDKNLFNQSGKKSYLRNYFGIFKIHSLIQE